MTEYAKLFSKFSDNELAVLRRALLVFNPHRSQRHADVQQALLNGVREVQFERAKADLEELALANHDFWRKPK